MLAKTLTVRSFSPPAIPVATSDLHTLLAKPQESLVAHTWHVLSRLADQVRLRPDLACQLDAPRLWHWLYWGTFLHDFGKAASGFQTMLRHPHSRKFAWGYRHEVLSLAFVEWLFPVGHPDRAPVIAVIACHHRDADAIIAEYGATAEQPVAESVATVLTVQVDAHAQAQLVRWLQTCGWAWAERLGFAPYIQQPAINATPITPQAIHSAIVALHAFSADLVFTGQPDHDQRARIGIMLRGLILIADHAGSAESRYQPFVSAALDQCTPLIVPKGKRLYPHQIAAGEADSDVLLIAPTTAAARKARSASCARSTMPCASCAPSVSCSKRFIRRVSTH